MNANVDDYLNHLGQWQKELMQLRQVLLATDLTEEWKWKQPCYTFDKKNVAIISPFKNYCALSFFKGVLLKDPNKMLVAPGKDSQTSRMFKFTQVDEIVELTPIIKAYIEEAIEIEKSGLQVVMKKTEEFAVPEELAQIFIEMPEFKEAFYQLTPGRQRGYLLNFAAAKQSKTRTARIEKYMDRIFDGKGIHDCVCGLSKRMPTCDGSHKQLA